LRPSKACVKKFGAAASVKLERKPKLEGHPRSLQYQFFQAAGNFLHCRMHEMEEERDPLGALMGALDWYCELKEILEEWRYGNDVYRRSKRKALPNPE